MPSEELVQVGDRPTRILSAGPRRRLSGGQSAPIVWLHDTFGNRWTEGHERLSESHLVIAPSLPGVEDSTTLDGIDSAEDVVFWLLDLLAEANLQKPVLLGCGLGGWMAAEFAVRYPDRLAQLVLVDAYGLRVAGALPPDEFALTPPMLRPLLFASPDAELAAEILPDTESPERVEAALHARVAAARLAWQFPYDRKLRARLARATLPALVVWGEKDRLVSLEHGQAYTESLPQARLVIVPGAGHYPYLEEPEQFADILNSFLRH